LTESSGIAASRAHPGVFWSHNDSGGGPYLYAFDRGGKPFGQWRVAGARSNDWEDIAIGPGPEAGATYLYIGDIGDNNRNRRDVTVYRVAEPDPRGGAAQTVPAEMFRLEYPDGPHDAECLMVHPRTGDVYIVTKARGADSATSVYKAAAPLRTGKRIALRRLGELTLPSASPITMLVGRVNGGDISPDGTRAVVCDYFGAWEAVLPAGAGNFDAIWKADWKPLQLGARAQGEAVCYRHDGRAVLATSEGESFPLIEVERDQHSPR
jgi:hypothetical protein